MKKFFSIIAMALITVLNASAATPQITDKYVSVKPFTEIELKGSTKIYFNQGDTTLVRIHGLDDGIDNVIVEQIDNRLIISQKSASVSSFGDLFRALKKTSIDETIAVYITSPDLTAIKVTGSGDFKVKGKLDTDNLHIKLTGSGDIDFANIVCDNLVAELQGSGDIDIEYVECVTSNIRLEGSGDIEIKQSRVRKTEVGVLGSGDVELKCIDCDEVNASIKGSGDIKLYGNIKTLNKSVRGSGDIIVKP